MALTLDEFQIQRLATVVADSNDAIILLDLNGTITAWNKGAANMYKYTEAEALKMNIFKLIPSHLKEEMTSMLSNIKFDIPIKPFETKRITKDGRLLDISLTVTKLAKNGENLAVALTERDITEHNQIITAIKKLPQQIIEAQEREKERLAMEIHDDLGQSLLALKILISSFMLEKTNNQHKIKELCEQMKKQLDNNIEKARSISHNLMPPDLELLGLSGAIKNLIKKKIKTKKTLNIKFNHRGISDIKLKGGEIHIYRIIQEALTNILKYACATKASISIKIKQTTFLLTIKDNGKGFDVNKQKKSKGISKGIGLAVMRERAALLNGHFYITSRLSIGTTISVDIPIGN